MENESKQLAAEEIARAARALAAQYEIDSAFVRVSMLSKIIGLSAPTIYAAMKAGRFPIPHRKVGTTPLVKLDDLAAWYCSQQQTSALKTTQHEEVPVVVDHAAKDRLIKSVMRELRSEED